MEGDIENVEDLEIGAEDDLSPIDLIAQYRLQHPDGYTAKYSVFKYGSIGIVTAVSLVLYVKQSLEYADCINVVATNATKATIIPHTESCSPGLATAGIYGSGGSNIATSANTMRETFDYFEKRSFKNLPPHLKKHFSDFLTDKSETANTVFIVLTAGISALPLAASVSKDLATLISSKWNIAEFIGTLVANTFIHLVPSRVLVTNKGLALLVGSMWVPTLALFGGIGIYKLSTWCAMSSTEKRMLSRWNQLNSALSKRKDGTISTINNFLTIAENQSFAYSGKGASPSFSLELPDALVRLEKGEIDSVLSFINDYVIEHRTETNPGCGYFSRYFCSGLYTVARTSLQVIAGGILPVIGIEGYAWSVINMGIFLSSSLSSELGWQIFMNSQISGPTTFVLGTLVAYYAAKTIGSTVDTVSNIVLTGGFQDAPAFKLYPRMYLLLFAVGLSLAALSYFPALKLCDDLIEVLKGKIGDGKEIQPFYDFLKFCATYSPIVFNQRNGQSCLNDAVMAYAAAYGTDEAKAFTHLWDSMQRLKADITYMNNESYAESVGLEWKDKGSLVRMKDSAYAVLLDTYKTEKPRGRILDHRNNAEREPLLMDSSIQDSSGHTPAEGEIVNSRN